MYCPEMPTQTSIRHRDRFGSLLRRCGLSLLCVTAVAFGDPQSLSAQQRTTSEASRTQPASGKIDPRLAQRIVQQAKGTRAAPPENTSWAEPAPQTRPKVGFDPSSKTSPAHRDTFESQSSSTAIRRISHQSEDHRQLAEDAAADSAAAGRRMAAEIQAARVQAAPLKPTPQFEESTFTAEAEQTESEQSHDVTAAGYKVTEKPAAMFLDLTGTAGSSQSATGSPSEVASSEINGGAEVTATENPAHVVMRAVAWVVIALCLFSLGALGVRRWQRQRGLLPASNSRSRVLETLSLGPGKTVSLIEMAGYRALVASDAGGIRQLVLASSSFSDDFAEMEQHVSEKPVASTAYQLSDFRSHLPAAAD